MGKLFLGLFEEKKDFKLLWKKQLKEFETKPIEVTKPFEREVKGFSRDFSNSGLADYSRKFYKNLGKKRL